MRENLVRRRCPDIFETPLKLEALNGTATTARLSLLITPALAHHGGGH